MVLTMLPIPSSWELTFGTICFFNDLIFKGCVLALTQSLLVSKGGVVIVLLVIITFNTNKQQTMHGLITIWAYNGHSNALPEKMNFLK